MKEEYEYCILGAGLAGLSVAKNITDLNDSDVLVLDPNSIAGGASGSPIGLVNPATGRYANQSWRATDSVQRTLDNFEDIAFSTDRKFFKKTGVIRPALEKKIATRMKENYNESYWQPGWCDWLEKDDIEQKYPGLACVEGGVQVNCGLTVAIPEYLNAIVDYLNTNTKTKIIESRKFDLEHNEVFRGYDPDYDGNPKNWPDNHKRYWDINFEDGTSTRCKTLIVTAGIKTTEYDFFRELPLIPVKGQVLVLECVDSFPYKSAVSAGGYFASLDGKTFVAGSTYEHRFDHENPDEYGEEYILKRLFRVMPELKGKIKIIDRWAGVRASTPDRLPILDNHPDIENCFVLAGLGSKGLLYSSLLGYELATHLTRGNKLSTELLISRFP